MALKCCLKIDFLRFMHVLKKIGAFLLGLKKRLSEKQVQVVAAVLVGLGAGALAVILKTGVHILQMIFGSDRLFSPEKTPFMIFLPTLGILLTVFFVERILRQDLGKGVANILLEISQKSAYVKRHKIFSHIISSMLTVGLGGSSGLEGPIVVTGAAVGSNTGRSLRLRFRDRTLLLGCGAAAGISAVFNAPIAGVMFALEILLIDLNISWFVPLVTASACGALFSKVILNEETTLFNFRLQQPFDYKNLIFYFFLAVLSGFIALYYAKVSHRVHNIFKKWKVNVYIKGAVGGLILAALIYFFPSLFSEGYESIRLLASGRSADLMKKSIFSEQYSDSGSVLIFAAATLFLKPLATSITLASGGNGGNFAPSLFVGSYLGFCFARLMNLSFGLQLPESNFAIVGMAGILSGVMYAPLTAIFLIAEVTGSYDLIIPLMLVSTFSTFFVRHFEPHSLEVKSLIERGELFTHDNKDQNILLRMRKNSLIETDFKTLSPEASLGDLVEILKTSRRNIFAVVEPNSKLVGMLTLDDVRAAMFDTAVYDTLFVAQLMKPLPFTCLLLDDDMTTVMHKFDDSNSWNLPVIDDEGIYQGFISKSAIFSEYRQQLMSMQ
jgi:chloride channel protein, CIC family